MVRWIDATQGSFKETFAAFLDEPRGEAGDVAGTVRDVIADVRKNGGEAVARYTSKFDRLPLDPVTADKVRCDKERKLKCPTKLHECVEGK